MKKVILLNATLIMFFSARSQHSFELYNNGDILIVESGALLYVQGDMHQIGSAGNIAAYTNNGITQVEGNLYSNTFFQQRGSGIVRLQNGTVNTGERQSINGSYVVRGGQNAIDTDDGAFYDLELANSQGVVYLIGTGNIADVKNSIDFNPSSISIDGMTIAAAPAVNRIITHDIGATGSITNPANGNDYTAIFGMMNPAAGMANYKNVSGNLAANTTTLDNAYIQGKHRRAIDNYGGAFGFPIGLEPSTSNSAARGVQYNTMTFASNTYDIITGHFQQGQDNIAAYPDQCSYTTDQYYGILHGQWIFTPSTAGSELYDMTIYPQDYAAPLSSNYFITKDNAASGSGCGTDPTGLTRTGFSGFSAFGFAGSNTVAPAKLTSFMVMNRKCNAILNWKTTNETNFSRYEIEYSKEVTGYRTVGMIDGGRADGAYTFTHTPANGTAYYRLKMVDIDGKHTYSNVLSVYTNCDNELVTLHPNPAQNHITIRGFQPGSEIQLFNSEGRLLIKKKAAANQVQLELTQFSTGIYNVIVIDRSQKIYSTKVIKMK